VMLRCFVRMTSLLLCRLQLRRYEMLLLNGIRGPPGLYSCAI